MANVDGSIRIGVQIEEQAYKRTLKQLHKDAYDTTKNIDKLFESIASGMPLDDAEKELKRIQIDMLKISQQASLFKERFKNLDYSKLVLGAEDIYRSLAKARVNVNELYNLVEGNGLSINIDDEEFNIDLKELSDSYNDFIAEISGIDVDLNTSNTIDFENLTQGSVPSFDLDGVIDKFSKVKMILGTTVSLMKKLFEFADYMANEFKESVDTVKNLGSALKKVVSTSFNLSKGILSFSHDALEALGIAEQLDDTMSSIGFGDLVGANLLADAIRELISAIRDLGTESVDMGKHFVSYYQNIERVFKDSKDAMYEYAKAATETLGLSESTYMKSAASFGTFLKGYIDADSEALSAISNGMAQLVADYASAYQNYSQDEIYRKLLSGLRGETEAIEDIGLSVKAVDMQRFLDKKGIDETWESLDSVQQTMYRVEMFFERAKEQEIWGIASSRTQTFAGQINYLNAQFENLKTTMGVYLMQVLTPVLGMLNSILAKIIDITNAFGAFLGLQDKYAYSANADSIGVSGDVITGYENAQDAIGGLASSEDDLAKSTKKAGAEAKKALAPFHQLNILQNNNSSSESSPSVGGLGSVIEPTSILDTNPISEVVNEWVEALKKAITAGDWNKVGKLLGQKVNQIVDKLDFKKYREKIYNGALNLAEIFNGLVETIDFRGVGIKLGDGVNTIVTTINLLLDRIKFEEVGSSISKMLRSFMASADWNQIAKLWTQKTRVLLDILHGFVTDMNLVNLYTGTNGWQELGKSLGEFVNSALDLEWERLGTDIGDAINGVSDAVISFNEAVDFNDIAAKMATGFNNLASSMDSAKVGQAIADTINSAIGAVGTFLSEDSFLELGMKIGNAVGTAIANIDWNEAADTVLAVADGIISLLAGAVYTLSQNYDKIFEGVQSFALSIVEWINDPANQDVVSEAINNFVDMLVGLASAIDWDKLYDGIAETLSKIDWADIIYLLHIGDGVSLSIKSIFSSSMLSGLVDAGLEFIGEIFKQIGEGVLSAIEGLIVTVGLIILGIPATLAAKVIQIGASIVDGIIEGITGEVSNLRESVDNFFQNIIDWVKDLFGIHSPSTVFAEIGSFLIEGLLNGIESIWGNITSFFSTSIGNLVTDVTNSFSSMKTDVEDIFNNLKTSVDGIATDIGTWVEDAFNTLTTNAVDIFNGMKESIAGVFDSLKEVIKTPINAILGFVECLVNGIVTGINKAIGALNGLSIDVPDWVPGMGGQTWGFNIPELSKVSIPRLADGAVIKPNQRFLAELGDQTRGVNIETPLNTMLEAFRGALADGNYGSGENIVIPVYIGSELIDEVVVDANNRDTYRNNGR